jgi:hypothetical protein
MINEQVLQELITEIRALNANVRELLVVLGETKTTKQAKPDDPKKARPKVAPLSEEEIVTKQAEFERMYETWLDSKELLVKDELERMSVEELRRFADANNLDVTAKMSKARIMELISLRFREKKLLMSNRVATQPLRSKLTGENALAREE